MIDLLSFTPSNLALTTHNPPQIGSSMFNARGRGHGHPPASLGRIVQHRIYDAWDIKHFKQVMDPDRYKKETDVKWYIEEEEEKE